MRCARGRLIAALWLLGAQAHADPSAQEAAQAKELFTRGKKLLEERRHAEACAVLAESQKLDPGTGTLLALALCHEGQGKTMTAWTEFKEVIALSRRDKRPDREALASEHAAALEGRLSRLLVRVSDEAQDLDGLTVTLDDRPLPPALWARPFPVDPGRHELRATATGREPFSHTANVGAERDEQVIDVPLLRKVRAAKEPPPAPPAKKPPEESPTAAYLVGAASLVALGVGGYYGLRAISRQGDAEKLCPRSPCGNKEGLRLNREARDDASVATLGVGVGIAAAIATYLMWPSSTGSARVQGGPWLGRTEAGGSMTVMF